MSLFLLLDCRLSLNVPHNVNRWIFGRVPDSWSQIFLFLLYPPNYLSEIKSLVQIMNSVLLWFRNKPTSVAYLSTHKSNNICASVKLLVNNTTSYANVKSIYLKILLSFLTNNSIFHSSTQNIIWWSLGSRQERCELQMIWIKAMESKGKLIDY